MAEGFVQNTYTFKSATIGQAGQISDTTMSTVTSFAAENTIEFGVAVKRGTDKQRQVLPWAENDATVPVAGISVFTYLKAPTSLNYATPNKYLTGDAVQVLRVGRVLVVAAANVTAGQKAYVIVDDDATAGTFTNVALNNVLVGTFVSSATATNLVELEVSING